MNKWASHACYPGLIWEFWRWDDILLKPCKIISSVATIGIKVGRMRHKGDVADSRVFVCTGGTRWYVEVNEELVTNTLTIPLPIWQLRWSMEYGDQLTIYHYGPRLMLYHRHCMAIGIVAIHQLLVGTLYDVSILIHYMVQRWLSCSPTWNTFLSSHRWVVYMLFASAVYC